MCMVIEKRNLPVSSYGNESALPLWLRIRARMMERIIRHNPNGVAIEAVGDHEAVELRRVGAIVNMDAVLLAGERDGPVMR